MAEPASALPPVEGGCLCGAVRYQASPAHRDGYYCHCRMCQLAFGNTRAAFVNVRKDEVRWTRSAPAYYASSRFARRGFCAQCGTPLSFEYLDSERMDLSAGSLDEPSAFKPTAHFAIESRIAAWHADDALPGERLDQNERIVQRWHVAYGDDAAPGLRTVREAEGR
jgi:hypothetical protein